MGRHRDHALDVTYPRREALRLAAHRRQHCLTSARSTAIRNAETETTKRLTPVFMERQPPKKRFLFLGLGVPLGDLVAR